MAESPNGSASQAYCEAESRQFALARASRCLASRSAEERVEWALANLPGPHVMSSSFGAQSAVLLHMVATRAPGIPVILVDTGYLFPETYRFVDAMTERLDLNLKVYRPLTTPAWQEARYGRRWEQGVEGIEAYNRENKVEPMTRALDELSAATWFAGLRRNQAATRSELAVLSGTEARWKVHPIVDWTDRDVYDYLTRYDLPYHPLWEQGYVSIGDVHTTRSLHEVDDIEQTRFFGLTRECGIHDITVEDAPPSAEGVR